MLQLITRIIFFWLVIVSCSNGNDRSNVSPKTGSEDTSVYREAITIQLAGGAYRKRATGYSLIVDSITSHLVSYFQEYNEGGVGVEIAFAENTSYYQQFKELQYIFEVASHEYQMDSLGGAYFYLFELGDLTIDITNQMTVEDVREVTNNRHTANFLLKSKLTDDLNNLLSPYQKQVDHYAIEHPMLIDTSLFIKENYISTPLARIPKKVLDGTI